MKISNLLELKKEIGAIITNPESSEFPLEILYSRGIEHKQFKITIEESEHDFFIDSNGNKWARVKDK